LSRNFKDNVKQVLKKNVVKKYFSGIDYSKSIEALSFYDSICAIKKFACPKDGSFKSVISGNENIGEVNCFRNEEESIQKVKRMFLG
jgi:hypothetical protein